MPLVDAYMNYTGGIKGGYKGSHHQGWSEVYEFSYNLGGGSPSLSITKPADRASNMLYYRYLQCRFKDAVGQSGVNDRTIEEINLELCRMGDSNNGGKGNGFAFIKYRFKGCRILHYEISRGDSDEDAPEEKLSIGFKKMFMIHHRPNDPSMFGWNFRENKKETPPGDMTAP
ncbi:type VI secretion system tube protein Hcp [Termitidicoccus mucosus]|uniref:Uncharacterized protein n=1 Tax=Termitidicoccus mucosus TaxID=1184151 RepID=A0A178ILB2_9BACT|nr:hypothetical protein AW736_07455 [Opitutaceae bacterium TSB47]